jgi:DNA-directed RNA polymerase specialized sigma24 family protein
MFGTCEDIDGKGTKCPRKSRCTSLCDPAEAKVNQDNVNYDNRLRIQNKKMPPTSKNEWIDYIAFTFGTDMPEPVIDMETMDQLEDLRLTSVQHNTLVSYFIDGLPMKRIGDIDGVSRQAIHNRLRRAGKAVHSALGRRMMWNDRIRHILNKLSDKEQSAVFFYYFELMSYGEISGAMNMKEGQIKTMIAHALEIA